MDETRDENIVQLIKYLHIKSMHFLDWGCRKFFLKKSNTLWMYAFQLEFSGIFRVINKDESPDKRHRIYYTYMEKNLSSNSKI